MYDTGAARVVAAAVVDAYNPLGHAAGGEVGS
jgi:hypothetical protein